MSENTDKRTATQKIEDLEKVVTTLYQATSQIKNAVENLLKSQGDMALVKDALKILNKKTEAIIQVAAPETGINVATVSALVVKMNVEELSAQVAAYVETGHLVATDTVAADSYIVAEEYGPAGELVNPRIQFRLDSQNDVTKAALTGKKVGETASFGENKFDAKILEVYTLAEPKAAEAPAAEAAPEATATTAEATATTAEAAPEATAATNAGAFDSPPTESPVVEFVPSGEMMTASGI